MYTYIHIFTCTHIYICTYIHVYMYACIHVYIYTYIRLYTYKISRRGPIAYIYTCACNVHICVYTAAKRAASGRTIQGKNNTHINTCQCDTPTYTCQIWTYIYMHTYIHVYLCTSIRLYVYTCIHIYTKQFCGPPWAGPYKGSVTYMYARYKCTYIHIYTYTQMHMYTYIHIYAYTCVYITKYIYTHVYVYTHSNLLVLPLAGPYQGKVTHMYTCYRCIYIHMCKCTYQNVYIYKYIH